MNNKDETEKRKKANKSVLDRFMRGETLATVPPEATWFPPRPLIPKNRKDILKVYGIKEEEKEESNE